MAAFIQGNLCFLRWANAAAILLWAVTLPAHLAYALVGFRSAAVGLGLAPDSATRIFATAPIILGGVSASYLLICARGMLSIARAQHIIALTAVGVLACEGLQLGFSHGEAAHVPSYTLCNLILFALAPLRAAQQLALAAFSLCLPIVVALATGFSLVDKPYLLAMMSLPLASVVLGLIALYWHYGSFLRRRLAELRLARRNAQIERQKRELERSRQIEQVRIKWLEQMARFLRHELRNAVVGATTSLTLLQRRSAIPEEDIYLTRTRQALRVIGALLDSVSNATSIESTVMKEKRTEVQLRQVIRDQTDVYRSIYPDRSFVFETDAEELIVLGRAERFIEMLDNLVSNAVDHAVPGTPIEVACRRIEDCIVVSVANEGPPLHDDQDIFGLFASFREGPRGDHLGLGLYMVKLIADRYGGRVEARSSTERPGAEFRVLLPIAHDRAA